MKTIHDAIINNNFSKLSEFLARGDDINLQDAYGNTPIMLAVWFKNLEMVNSLLHNKPDLWIKNNQQQICLSLAEHSTPEILQKIVVQYAVNSHYIEVNDNDHVTIIINKLITTLLYQSRQHGWDSLDCNNLKYYIQCLSPSPFYRSEKYYENYIRTQETRNREFYGSYLSDDSDSDEEQRESQNIFLLDQKNLQAQKFVSYGQIDNLFYKNNVKNKKSGDFKSFKQGSDTFDLSARTVIHYSHEEKARIEQDLNALNGYLRNGDSLEEAQRKTRTSFYLAQYRGVTHLTSKWNQSSRRAHRKDNEIGKPQYSASLYKANGIEIYKDYAKSKNKLELRKEEIDVQAKTLQEILLNLRARKPCTFERYNYLNIAYLLQNMYTQNYDGFHQFIATNPLMKSLLLNDVNPFVSTGDVPYHALKYAYGIKPYTGHEGERLRPRWKNNGKAERPYSGVTYVSVHPLTDYDDDGPLHLISLNRNAEIRLVNELNIIAERESCFPAFIGKDRIIHKHVAKYPSFLVRYKRIYHYKYGISADFYNKLCAKFINAAPHSAEMTEFKQVLGEWLCSYYEVKLIDIAREAAVQRGGVLVYRDINGYFALTPPVDSVNRNTLSMTQEIKSPVKQKQNRRISLTSAASLSPLSNSPAAKSIINEEKFNEYDDLFSSMNDNNWDLSIEFVQILTALENKRYLALQYYLQKPALSAHANQKVSNDRFEDASLLHIAILNQDIKALNILLKCPDTIIQSSTETTSFDPPRCHFYENISALALAIIDNREDIVDLLIESGLFQLDETVSYVENKDLLDNLIVEPTEEHKIKDEDWLGMGWAGREGHFITRVRNVSLLHLAVIHKNEKIIKKIIDAGAPLNIKASDAGTALTQAEFNKNIVIIGMIRAAEDAKALSLDLSHLFISTTPQTLFSSNVTPQKTESAMLENVIAQKSEVRSVI